MRIELFIFARNFFMKKLILFISFICITTTSNAQIYEIGIVVGGSNYFGDVGSEYYINPNNLMGGAIFKWNVNPQVALRGNFTYSQLSGEDYNASSEARQARDIRFVSNIKEFAVGIEYSFFKYNIDNFKQKQTPYLLFQLAAVNYDVNIGTKTTMSIPFGIGYKTRIARDFAMAFELRTAYTFTDELDDRNKDNNNVWTPAANLGNPNNNDWYTFLSVSFVYAFGRPPCYATPY